MTNLRTADTAALIEELRRRQVAVITVDAADVTEALRDSGAARGRGTAHMEKFAGWLMGDGANIMHIESLVWDEARRWFRDHLIVEHYHLFIGETEGWPDEEAA